MHQKVLCFWKQVENFLSSRVFNRKDLNSACVLTVLPLRWAPEKAPALFAEILPGQEGTAIGEWVQPDSTNPYSRGDRVMFGGKVYESLIDGNVWSPAAYPAGWQEVV